ncbi:hypothetical protein MATL_G00105110 [Megalops atlanticus]|uniref:UHRF1-binding protein 1 n=1 Tax=Megalops atlanticus TaxID=7932 RepID=A0A9D3Q236_MEGAT|nr:hypothetical protein MATL_G00105110 [Megalops atlanticus]
MRLFSDGAPFPGDAHAVDRAPAPPPPSGTPSTLSQYFELHDVKESSYHTYISRLDLHICNDSSSLNPDEPHPRGAQGAMQLTFRKLGFDYYPFHRPGDGCRHWERHCGAMESRAQWASKLLQEFQRRVEETGFPGPQPEPPNTAKDSPAKRPQDGDSTPKSSPPDRGQTSRRSSAAPPPASSPQRAPWKRLRSSCVVVRLDDLDIHQVSTGGRHSKKTQSLLSCPRKALHLADNVPAVHLQFTEYYFPDNPGLLVPCSNLYAQVNGLQLCLDMASLLWMNLFSQGLLRTLEQVKAFYHLQDSGKGEEHVDVRMDAAQLKLVIPLESSILDHPDRPQSLSVSVPQVVLSNTPTAPCPFPRDQSAFNPLPPAFLQHALEADPPLGDKRPPRAQDVWSLSLSRLALSFEGARRGPKGKALPFVEPFAMSVWLCHPAAFKLLPPPFGRPDLRGSASFSNHVDSAPEQPGSLPKSSSAHDPLSVEEAEQVPLASIHILAQSISPVKVWLSHYQYVALLRMKDSLARLGAELARDTQWAGGKRAEPPTVCLALLMDAVEAGLLLPPATGEPDEEARSPGETDSPSMTDSELSPARVPGPGPLEDSGIGNGAAHPEQEQEPDGPVEEACEALEEEVEGEGEEGQEESSGLSPPLSPGHHPLQSRDASSFSLEGELSNALSATKDATKEALSASLDLTKGALSMTKDAFSLLSRGSAMSKMLFTPQNRDQPQRPEDSAPASVPGNLRLQSMKHSPSQHSFDSAILEGSLPDDGLSVDSDTSENFVILVDSESGMESMRPDSVPSLPVDPPSRSSPAPGTEGGSSADLSSSLSQSTEDMAQDTASVLLLQLSVMGCVVDMKGEDVVVALEAQELTPKQLGNQRVSELLGGLTLGGVSPHKPSSPAPRKGGRGAPVVRMRMEMGPAAGRHSPLSESAGFLELSVGGCQAELLASTLATLGPFLEDELSADVQPMRIHLDRTTITLKDDGPKVYPTAPQPVPVTFALDSVVLERTDDGIFWLRADTASESAVPKQSVTVAEGDSAGGDRVFWEQPDGDGSVPQPENESQTLESQLSDAKAALAQALSERERLLLELRKYDPLFSL